MTKAIESNVNKETQHCLHACTNVMYERERQSQIERERWRRKNKKEREREK